MLVTRSSCSSVFDTEMATFTFEEQRVIIRFLHLCGMKPIEIHRQLSETCSDAVMDVKNVCSWVRQFKEGRTSCLRCNAEKHNTDNRWNNLNCIFITNVTRKYTMSVPLYRKHTCLRIPNNSKKNSYVSLQISMYVFKLRVHSVIQNRKKWKNRVCLI